METSQLRFGCLVCLLVIAFAESALGGTLTVLWNHSTDARTAGYLVSYGTQPGKYTGTVKAGYVTSVNVTGLTNGTLYYFVVQSHDKDNVAGAPSTEVSGRVPTSTAPNITCPSPVVTSLDGKAMAVTLSPTVTGGVTPVSTTCSPPSGSLFPVGTTSFACTAVDAAQQKDSCTSSVVVMTSTTTPTTQPTTSTSLPLTIKCPTIAPVTADKNGTRTKVVYADPIFSGGTAPVEVRCRPRSGSRFPLGKTTVECEATDAKEQTASCTTTVTVNK
jgi:HYR domain-containing protein/fibronectin type III domain protein